MWWFSDLGMAQATLDRLQAVGGYDGYIIDEIKQYPKIPEIVREVSAYYTSQGELSVEIKSFVEESTNTLEDVSVAISEKDGELVGVVQVEKWFPGELSRDEIIAKVTEIGEETWRNVQRLHDEGKSLAEIEEFFVESDPNFTLLSGAIE